MRAAIYTRISSDQDGKGWGWLAKRRTAGRWRSGWDGDSLEMTL